MTIFNGSSGDDTFGGSTGPDTYFLGDGGNDTADGGLGNDVFVLDAALTAADTLRGNRGFDELRLDGDYNLTLGAGTISSIELISLAAGHTYKLKTNDANITTGSMTVDGSALGAGDALTFDGAAETTGKFVLNGGAADDRLTGGARADQFDLSAGGSDRAFGGDGDDVFTTGAALNRGDRIDGGAGFADKLVVDGDCNVSLSATTLVNVEKIAFAAGHDYTLTTNDANVTGPLLEVDGSAMGAGDRLRFDASAETGSSFLFSAGAGNDVLTGATFANLFDLTLGGNDTATGGGLDNFLLGDTLTAADRIDGGSGVSFDTLVLDGDYSAGLTLASQTIRDIEIFKLAAGHDYKLTFADGNVVAGQTMLVDAGALDVNSADVDCSAETDGHLQLIGDRGDDNLTGGGLSDLIIGNLGSDTLKGGGGADTFDYGFEAVSTSTVHDKIVGFDTSEDLFELSFNIGGVDGAVTAGTLSNASFDADLSAAVGSAQLGKHHAVLFTADAGSLAGHTFLVVDFNNAKGYQATEDVVIELTNGVNLGALSVDNFV